ncbi:hypothetical protein GCM10023405_01140 [Streptomonospora salina]
MSTSASRADLTKRSVDTATPSIRSRSTGRRAPARQAARHACFQPVAAPGKAGTPFRPQGKPGICPHYDAAAFTVRREHGSIVRVSIIIRILINAVALGAAVYLIDGLNVDTASMGETAVVYLVLAIIFGVVNGVIKPIVKTVGCAFYILTLGLISLVVNALLLLLTAWIAGVLGLSFTIDGFVPAVLGAIVVAVVSWVLSLVLPGDDD